MISHLSNEVLAEELFKRLAHETPGSRFGLFSVARSKQHLSCHRELPPTRSLQFVLMYHYKTGVTTTGARPLMEEALDLLRKKQVLDDLSGLSNE